VWTGWVLFEFHLGIIENSYVLQQEDKLQQVDIHIKIQAVASCMAKTGMSRPASATGAL